MTRHTPRTAHILPLIRKSLLAAAAGSAVVLMAACSSPAPSASPTATAPATTVATAPATTTAAPSQESAVKKLVAGFPSTVLPLMKGAEIQSSSIAHAVPVSQASLTASVTASSADVLAYYTKVFTDQGFKAQPGDSVDGVPVKTFVRAEGQEILTVSIVQTAATATFTLGATLLPASFK
ncbi:hypothetical protein AAGW05_17360 [Arthrobacter sp. LAPM80]|uniref:hypothetical protein n=1 Tax=Arthrobacter sp. LAPM80 TaxID=3141788 RepID=UPI00398A646E